MVSRGTNDQNESEEPINPHIIQIQGFRESPYSSLSWAVAENVHFISTTFQYLHTSGWYWGGITASEARGVLNAASEGTFFVRDSNHPNYLFTLSVQTNRGPTNIRLELKSGHFQLDSMFPAQSCILSFTTIPGLVQHYVSMSHKEEKAEKHKSIIKDSLLVLKLTKPLRQPKTFPTLQHLSRLCINRHTDCPTQLPLPRPLLLYLHEYPFHL